MRISDWSSDVCSSDLVRDEGNYNIGVVEAVEEVITVAREAKIPGVVTHLKVLGPQVWGKSADVIAHIDKARASGVAIRADQYHYTASGSSLTASLVPGWAPEGGPVRAQRRGGGNGWGSAG